MPWVNDVAGVVEAWYPGIAGGQAIAVEAPPAFGAASGQRSQKFSQRLAHGDRIRHIGKLDVWKAGDQINLRGLDVGHLVDDLRLSRELGCFLVRKVNPVTRDPGDTAG